MALPAGAIRQATVRRAPGQAGQMHQKGLVNYPCYENVGHWLQTMTQRKEPVGCASGFQLTCDVRCANAEHLRYTRPTVMKDLVHIRQAESVALSWQEKETSCCATRRNSVTHRRPFWLARIRLSAGLLTTLGTGRYIH